MMGYRLRVINGDFKWDSPNAINNYKLVTK